MDDPSATSGPIALRLQTIRQLFHTLDPSPFREGDLAAEAEAYILRWARDLPASTPIAIRLHLPREEAGGPAAGQAGEAIRRFFDARAREQANEIRELFRFGRRALAIGLGILSVCLLLALGLGAWLREGLFVEILRESLVIIGWVAIWRPAEIFLYEWLPLARQRDLFRRLAAARVELHPLGEADTAPARNTMTGTTS